MIEENITNEFSNENQEEVKRTPIVPGEIIESGEDFLPGEGTMRVGKDIISTRLGLAEKAGRLIRVISLFGAYYPRKHNTVLGRVVEVTYSGWLLDIDTALSAFLPLEECSQFINRSEMEQFLAVGDVVSAKIFGIKAKGIDVSIKGRGLGKLEGGFIFKVNSSRVPRIIGKEGSMINLIKEKTGCQLTVGQNGWVWIKGEIDSQIKARKAVEFIADKAFISGLTEKMEEWFNNYDN
jgi:exosome complex component RRP4